MSQRTLAISKPDAVGGVSARSFSASRTWILRPACAVFSQNQAEGFTTCIARVRFQSLTAFIVRPQHRPVLESNDAIKWRTLTTTVPPRPIGRPAEGIRRVDQRNATHGSDAPETAAYGSVFLRDLDLI
jgi:nucleoside diphosphate kinase